MFVFWQLMHDDSLGLIDYGQVKQLSPPQLRALAKVVLAVASNDSEV
jgi:hypothetical protein